MIIHQINKINVNPFLGSMIIQSFYKGYNNKNCPLLLHYLILPIIMYSDIREILNKSTKLDTLFKTCTNNKIAFLGLQERIWDMNILTDLTLINMHSKNEIAMTNDIEIFKTLDYTKDKLELKEYLKAAFYLGVIFAKDNTHTIFKHLKVIP